MTDSIALALSAATTGQHVTVWNIEDGYRTWGQGGRITATSPHLSLEAAGTTHTFEFHEFAAGTKLLETEVPTAASECIQYGDTGADCSGEVEYFDPSGRGNAFQRCAKHRDERMDSYQNSMEIYAHSAAVPSWFDPAEAGETWFED